MTLSKIPHHLLKRYPLGYNHIVNGNFDIWQKADSQNTSAFGSDDFWFNFHIGTTKVHSKQAFAVGEVFPDGKPTPKYYSRTVVTSVAGANNYCGKRITIPDIQQLAGKKVRFSFYAKANAAKTIAMEVARSFGTGGSAIDVGIVIEKITISAVWTKYTVKMTFPDIIGKTIGATDNHAHYIHLWFDAGTTYNTRTNSLGQQSGTFDIACVSLIEGDVDIPVLPRTYAEEFKLCTMFYEERVIVGQRQSVSYNWGGSGVVAFPYNTEKYIIPIVTLYADVGKTLSGQIVVAGGVTSPAAISGIGMTINKDCLYLWNNTCCPTLGGFFYGWATIDGSF